MGAEAQVIVAAEVTNQPPDVEHFVPMLERVVENCGRPRRRARTAAATPSATCWRPNSRRKVIAEPPFGQIKQARGLRQLLLRGLEKVRAEWPIICLTHNLLKLRRASA